jgi:hypothetical protein
MSSGSEAGSYLKLINFVYHSTLGSREKRQKYQPSPGRAVIGKSSIAHEKVWGLSSIIEVLSAGNK